MKFLNIMPVRRARRWLISVGLLACFAAASSQAAVVELSFSGTYNTMGTTVFGLSGLAVPYHYQITYDTSLNTNPWSFPAGSSFGDDLTAHEWHGYSASGILGCSLSFGTNSWTATDIRPREVVGGVSADLWFDTDLNSASPTRVWAVFSDPSRNDLQIGVGVAYPLSLEPMSFIMQQGLFGGTADSSDLSVQVVPEPTMWAVLLVGGLVSLCHQPGRSRDSFGQRWLC